MQFPRSIILLKKKIKNPFEGIQKFCSAQIENFMIKFSFRVKRDIKSLRSSDKKIPLKGFENEISFQRTNSKNEIPTDENLNQVSLNKKIS